ncbi:MAG: queuosine salvage family protein [Syntrophotaleaceae bacterium]
MSRFIHRGLFEEIRHACRRVAQRSIYVTVDFEQIPRYASSLPLEQALHPQIDPACHYLGQDRDTLAFFLILDAVNFGSGYFAELGLPSGRSGYFTMAEALTRRFQHQGPCSAAFLSRLTTGECLELFGQDPRNPAAVELMGLFAASLNDLGRYLRDHFCGDPVALVEEAEGRAAGLVDLLAAMPMYRDEADYRGLRVPFYKRAQLTVADLAIAFAGRTWGCFADLPDLTLFADNLVPHVLRYDGLLNYQEDLAAAIDAGTLISAGSPEEVELRACAVHAVELLTEELRRRGHDVTAMGLDQLLWNRGQQLSYRRRPRHRTKTVFY